MKTSFKNMAQKGFTLIELIITIVIIGVLAAVAIPKFQDLSSDAERGVALGIAGAAASASSVAYARFKAGTAAAVASCTALESTVDKPAGYTFSGTIGTGGTTGTCNVLKGTAGSGTGTAFSPAVTFQAYGA